MQDKYVNNRQHFEACLHFWASKFLLTEVRLPYDSNQLVRMTATASLKVVWAKHFKTRSMQVIMHFWRPITCDTDNYCSVLFFLFCSALLATMKHLSVMARSKVKMPDHIMTIADTAWCISCNSWQLCWWGRIIAMLKCVLWLINLVWKSSVQLAYCDAIVIRTVFYASWLDS